MPGVGFYQRTKPYLAILRGDTPNDPLYLSETAPVLANQAAGYISSGQLITLVLASGVWEWNLGWAAGRVPHWARQDSASPDVLESGVLTGLSALGKFRLRTGYYDTGGTYTAGTPIVPDSTAGDIVSGTGAAGDDICGHVSNLMNGPLDISDINNEASTSLVVDFDTTWVPLPA